MSLVECHECKQEISDAAESCPNCGALSKDRPATKPKKWYERTSVTLCVAAALVLIGFGFIHVITGVTSPHELPIDVVRKDAFGYRETFINAAKIKALPYLAARAKYPIGYAVLQLHGYLPSGHRFEARVVMRLHASLKRWQAQFDQATGRRELPWEQRFQGQAQPATDPEGPHAYNQRGITLAKSAQYESALAAFSRAIAKDPAFADAYHNRSLVYLAIGNLGQAAADIGRIVEIKPQFIEGHLHRARLHMASDSYDEALAAFDHAIAIDPRCAEAYFKRALIHYAKARYDKAWKDVRKVQSLNVAIPSGFLVALQDATGAPDS
jgi:tetratricopeptide (TPR) repeat protein